ncbi:AsmA family protein [Brumimicrobium aurantiacum]|uniref:AsmA family protein n=1 Tax=Brumimicrobium aurantiacum TaxID=1737063 RepID=A0A3E1F1M3_9FLAO|nr:AsmA-like C-terminal region-containing protein [Brumimicrobium aurantiacum]RFC55718.1 AsmA family protein [Brumimicrobium aurantiacum]
MNWKKAFNIFKWVAGITIGLMLAISALILVFKDDIKSYALKEANKYLNKRVHIGYIDVGIWKSFPDMRLSFDDVLVHSKFDTTITADTAIYAKKIDLRFNPLDFFNNDFSVHRIDIDQAKLNLKILENGQVNYDFLKPSEDTTNSPFEFNLERINLRATDFTYHNESTQQFYEGYFKNLDFNGSFNEKQFVLNALTEFDVKTIQSKSLTLIENKSAKCDISIQMDQINDVFEIISADLSINKLPFLVRGKVSNDSLNFYVGSRGLELSQVANNFSIQELDVVDEINGQGKVNFELFIRGANEKTKSPAIDANFNIENGSLSEQGFSLSNINLNGSYTNGISTGKEQVVLSKLQFNTLNEAFSGNLSISDFDRPRLRGKAKGLLDLKAIHRLFGPFSLSELSGSVLLDGNFDLRMNSPKTDPQNLTIYDLRASLRLNNIITKFMNDERAVRIKDGKITIRNQFAGITDLSVSLNQSSLTLDGQFNHLADYFKGARNLSVDASVSSDFLNLDDLSSTQEETSKSKAWILPNKIDGKLMLTLNEVIYSDHQYTFIKGKMNFGKRKLTFPYVSGVSAKAKINGRLKITETRPMYLVVETSLSSPKVNFKPLFAEWNNFDQTVIKSENINGSAKIQLDFKGPFDLYEEEILKEKFDVKAKVKITDGALMNVEPFKEITQSLRASGGGLLIKKSKIDAFEARLLNLQFDSFENEFTVKNGVITIPKMTIRSNALDVNLSGTHSFDNAIDYSFDFRFREIKGTTSSEFGDVIDDGTGFRVFLKMYGTIDYPEFKWDKEAKKAVKEEKREEAKDDLKSALKTGFGINKKDTTIKEIKTTEKPKEKIIMDFGQDTIQEDFTEESKKKKKNALQRKIDAWKKENEKEKEESIFEFE